MSDGSCETDVSGPSPAPASSGRIFPPQNSMADPARFIQLQSYWTWKNSRSGTEGFRPAVAMILFGLTSPLVSKEGC
eukprot:s1638_g6.t1